MIFSIAGIPKFRRRFMFLLLSFIAPVPMLCLAQIPSETDVTSTPVPNAGHDYIHSLAETVNPANGALSIRISIPLPPSRGLTLPFSIAYDSNGSYYLGSPCQQCNGINWLTTTTMLAEGGWSYTVPLLSVQADSFSVQTLSPTDVAGTFDCHGLIDFVMQDPSGNRHNLGLAYYNPNQYCQNPDLGGTAVTVPSATVGPYLAQTSASWAGAGNGSAGKINPVLVTDGDGTSYAFASATSPTLLRGCPTETCQPATYPPYYVSDRNGNAYEIAYTKLSRSAPQLTYTDSIGRTALSIPTFQANPDQLTVSGFSNPFKVYWTTVQANFSVTMSLKGGAACAGPGTQPPVQAISGIVLPNGQQFTFDYSNNSYGMVDKITYPSGGYVRYVWGSNSLSEYGQWPIFSALYTGGTYESNTCDYYYDTPAIAKRFVSFDGQHEVLEQDFSYSTCWGGSSCPNATNYPFTQWVQKTTTVTTKDISRGTQFSTSYSYSSIQADPQPNAADGLQPLGPYVPVESQIQYSDTNGTLLKTIAELWGNERIMTQQTTSSASSQSTLVSQTNWTYDSNEMVTEKDDYDFGVGGKGAPMRKTISSYHPFTASHIVDKPDMVKVQTASGSTLGEVQYSYDAVGNMLSHSDWVTPNGATVVTTSHKYDAYGNIVSTTDPANNVTSYSYAANPFVDSCSFSTPASSYLTNIAYPSVNGVAHQESFQYYCASGNLASSTDENAQTTSYKYNSPPSGCSTSDGLDRLSEIDYPDGGKKTLCYADGTYPPNGSGPNMVPSVSTSVLMSINVWKTTVAAMDGMGNQVWGEASDPQGISYVNTVFDGEGNVSQQSNPSYATTGLAYTTYTYDALRRKTHQTNTDGTSRQWCYNGLADQGQPGTTCVPNKGTERSPINLSPYPWVDVVDENGSHWQQISDGLGRLAAAIEPNTSDVPALETDYQYDVLGNLIQVDQWGGAYGSAGERQRVFAYDGLSRLVTSLNPESGATSYGYLTGGVPCSGDPTLPCNKVDARGIAVNYAYDSLNRITSKYYGNDASSTPTACYQYDSSGAQYAVGRLTTEWTQKANPAQGATQCTTNTTYLTQRSIQAYDPLGRIWTETQCTQSGCRASTPCTTSSGNQSYGYDLAGNLVCSGNGISATPGATGTLSFNSSYDTAGRLQTVTSSAWTNSATHPTTLFSAQAGSGACGSTLAYAAFGGLQNATYGNGLAINRSFDNRLRPSCETDTGKLVVNATPGTAVVAITGAEQSH